VSYPPFPGNEANYLRAQVARISASTHISPIGYYLFDDEDDEQAKLRGFVQQNPEFDPLSLRDLTDHSLSSWVHHVLHILPQVSTHLLFTSLPPLKLRGYDTSYHSYVFVSVTWFIGLSSVSSNITQKLWATLREIFGRYTRKPS